MKMFTIINKYLLKNFFIKLIIVLTLFICFGILIEFVSKVNKFDFFKFLTSFEKVFGFIFFITTAWFAISLQKSREFTAILTSGISSLKIAFLISFGILIFSFFYIFIYDGIILKTLSKNNQNTVFLNRVEIYNNEGDCDFKIILFDNIYYQNDEFVFKEGDVIGFKDCKFNFHSNFREGEVVKTESGILISDSTQTLNLNYNFKIFKSYFEEQVQNKSFKTIIAKVFILKDFIKYKISGRSLTLEIMDFLQNIFSFLYMSLLAFAFFAKIPPRSEVILKIFYAGLMAAVIYITNMIALSYIKQITLLNPIFILLPSFIIISTEIMILIYKRV